ncbi:hypothetical protein [Rhodococcus wratislaviensis]|uniref:DUF3263 domain-containing protein n=1 Tax=Rhodococcus wratislaviensis NBRC 100605 TaxID=1219028 RepID=X0PMR8_RHOWR|nr:hypothetical protein [Rhodococcus wratislaviensis]GAF43778.1 hypothetical protein RW1_009_02030 [Rhodococcus wratislaviensis NBRC 100605]
MPQNKNAHTARGLPCKWATDQSTIPGHTRVNAVVDLALRWLPYGGPEPDDIFVQFGFGASTFAIKIDEFLATNISALSMPERNALREMAAALKRTRTSKPPRFPDAPH